jgi:hypothetical protein
MASNGIDDRDVMTAKLLHELGYTDHRIGRLFDVEDHDVEKMLELKLVMGRTRKAKAA